MPVAVRRAPGRWIGPAGMAASEGKVVRLVHYLDRVRALADVDPGAHCPSS